MSGSLRAVAKDSGRRQPIEPDPIRHGDVDAALWNALLIARLFVTRLAAAAAFVDRNLGIGVDELELIGRDRRRFAQPQPLTVDLEPHGAQEASLPEIEAGERACSSGVARCCHDEQRGPVPGAQNVVADECARASTL